MIFVLRYKYIFFDVRNTVISIGCLLCRVEPLICKEFIDKRPIIIPYHRGGKRLHIGFQVSYACQVTADKICVPCWCNLLFFSIVFSSWYLMQEFTEEIAVRSHVMVNQINSLRVGWIFILKTISLSWFISPLFLGLVNTAPFVSSVGAIHGSSNEKIRVNNKHEVYMQYSL